MGRSVTELVGGVTFLTWSSCFDVLLASLVMVSVTSNWVTGGTLLRCGTTLVKYVR